MEGNWGYIPSGADTVIPFKTGDIKKIVGTFVSSTLSTVSVTIGFKPKILFVVGNSHISMYSEEINYYMRSTISKNTAEIINLNNTAVNRINSITSDGFIFGKSNVGVETLTYYAYL